MHFSPQVTYEIMWGRRLGFAKVVQGANVVGFLDILFLLYIYNSVTEGEMNDDDLILKIFIFRFVEKNHFEYLE